MSKRKGRLISGILVLDKPVGITSNKALQEAKSLFFAAKAGHAGSLDPAASGVLPICFGEATKFSQYLLDSNKVYKSTLVLGCVSSTGDIEGEISETNDASNITTTMVETVLSNFRGNIEQVPSMYSALKYKGRRLYELARDGKEVERKARKIKILVLEQLDFRAGKKAELDIYVVCSKGTYIRTLAEDIGSVLGVGAYVSVLRRVKAGPYVLGSSISLDLLRKKKSIQGRGGLDSILLPMDTALSAIPKIYISDPIGNYLLQGQPVIVPNAPSNGMVRLAFKNGEFLGLGEIMEDGRVAPRRMVIGGTKLNKLSANLRG